MWTAALLLPRWARLREPQIGNLIKGISLSQTKVVYVSHHQLKLWLPNIILCIWSFLDPSCCWERNLWRKQDWGAGPRALSWAAVLAARGPPGHKTWLSTFAAFGPRGPACLLSMYGPGLGDSLLKPSGCPLLQCQFFQNHCGEKQNPGKLNREIVFLLSERLSCLWPQTPWIHVLFLQIPMENLLGKPLNK